MNTYAVDFETYYDKEYSIKTMGVEAYCADPRFDAYFVSIHGHDVSYDGPVNLAPWDEINGHRWVSHNAGFDQCVYQHLLFLEYGRGIIPSPAVWECTADLSVYLSCPRSLAGASEALLGVRPDKTVRSNMLGKHWSDLSDDEKQALADYAQGDAVGCYRLWDEHSDKWPEHERTISRINRECGSFGVNIDAERLQGYLDDLKTVMWKAEVNIPWDWSGNKTPLSPKMLRLECRKTIIGEGGKPGENIFLPCPASLAATSEECIAWEQKYGDRFPWVGAMRDWRRSNILLKRLETIQKRLRPDGTFPFSIKYFGGHTGRFSGGGGFNVQNMPRGAIMGVDLRSLFIPRQGKQFVIADLAQIEARVTLWLARDWETMDKVAEGMSVYEAHAVAAMKYDPSRGKLKQVDPELYQLAKARVLGLGFGCGWARFLALAKTNLKPAAFERVFHGEVTDSEVDEFVRNIEAQRDGIARIILWRELPEMESREWVNSWHQVAEFRMTNPKIVSLWRELHVDCVRSKGKTFTMELPSGRELTYYDVRTFPKLNAEIVRTERRTSVYGGLLTENLVQAAARDVFVAGMLRLHEAGYRILFHVHDEYVIETDIGADIAPIKAIIEQTPDWLPRCPIGAEVDVADRYLK